MMKITRGVGVALVLLAGVGCSVSAQDEVLRQVRDRAEIEALMWRYVRALDTADPDAYAAVYTPDGQFSAGANATKGRDALRKMVDDMRQRRVAAEAKGQPQAPMYHMTMNYHLEFVDRDRARMRAYWQTVFGAVGQTPVRVAAAGRSIDELVKVDGQWLIQSRNVGPTTE
jgi:3-phenylpropionate/cinnamic acid dioxygenase small subunit